MRYPEPVLMSKAPFVREYKPVHSVWEFVGLDEVAFRELVKADPATCKMPLCDKITVGGKTLCFTHFLQFRKAAKRTFLRQAVSP